MDLVRLGVSVGFEQPTQVAAKMNVVATSVRAVLQKLDKSFIADTRIKRSGSKVRIASRVIEESRIAVFMVSFRGR